MMMFPFGPINSAWGIWMVVWMIFIILLFVGIGVVIFKAIRGDFTSSNSSAIHILDEKFARGEIGQDEYISKKKILKGK